ncbi:hypothetical protein, partial [Acinetobacter pittii]|uniref:hypothetical protein n=1 Tax=Acinetobacter pittii TaxID=48296 RepID=UPI00111D97D3
MYSNNFNSNYSFYLFESYIKVKNYKNAKKLFEKHKDSFLSFDNLINLCHEMASDTLDWSLCDSLISEYEISDKNQAWLWALKIKIAQDLSSTVQIQKLLKNIPEILEGRAETICWIAAQEVLANLYIKARNRIKLLWRKNLNNVKVETEIFKLFNSFLNFNKSEIHPFFEENILTIQKGMVIT